LLLGAIVPLVMAQEGRPYAISLEIDERHLAPRLGWGGGGVPSDAGCAEVFFAGNLLQRSGYELSYEHRIELSIDLQSGVTAGSLSGTERIQSTRGEATCSWQGSLNDRAEVTTPQGREPWQVVIPGAVNVGCTGWSRCSVNGEDEKVNVRVDQVIPVLLWIDAQPGGEILRFGLRSDPALPLDTYRLSMEHLSTDPFPEVVFPAAPGEAPIQDTPAPLATLPAEAPVEPTAPQVQPTPSSAVVSISIPDLIADLQSFLSGGEARAPAPGRAAAASVASGSLLAAWVAANILLGRDPKAVQQAVRAVRGQGQPAATPSQAASPDLDLRQHRALWRQRLLERAHRVMVLEEIERDLRHNVGRLYRQWDLARRAGLTDGLLDLIDLEVSIMGAAYGGSSALSTALSHTPAKDAVKIAVRNHMARRLGATPQSGGQVLKGVWDSATGSGGLPKLIVQNSAKGAGGALSALGRAYGPAESAASMGRTFLKNKARVAALRSAFKEGYADWLRIRRDLEDARAAAAEARSALDSANAAVRELQAQFPRRFRDL
jgi:hypothetical protein